MTDQPTFLEPRRCMREPIPEIFEAADLLDKATSAHLNGRMAECEELIRAADIPAIRQWTDSLWGSLANHPEQPTYHRRRSVAGAPGTLAKPDRVPVRMPSATEKAALVARFGFNCAFCRVPLIRKEVRLAFLATYPQSVYWGTATAACHAAFQCMWMQYDHVLPHSRGGGNSLENLVLTCAGCNFGRMSNTLEEVGLMDPRHLPIEKTPWDGLERFLTKSQKGAR